MKSQLASIVNGSFWMAADYSRDLVAISLMNTHTSLAAWSNTSNISLDMIKANMTEIGTLDPERRRQLNCSDASYREMCFRIAVCAATADSQSSLARPTDRSMLQVNSFQSPQQYSRPYQPPYKHYQKNDQGLARARQPYRESRPNNDTYEPRRSKGGKGGKGGKGSSGKTITNPCRWEECQSGRPHSRADCPV